MHRAGAIIKIFRELYAALMQCTIVWSVISELDIETLVPRNAWTFYISFDSYICKFCIMKTLYIEVYE